MVNINEASREELIEIIHIGPKRADDIIERRSTERFKDLYELSSLKGFGTKRIEGIINEGKLTC
jgi:DNA uptake protein ComE-like DNA-binding protein